MGRPRLYLEAVLWPDRVLDAYTDPLSSYRFSSVQDTPGWGRLIVETKTAQLKLYVNVRMLRQLIQYLANCLTDLENENRTALRKEVQDL